MAEVQLLQETQVPPSQILQDIMRKQQPPQPPQHWKEPPGRWKPAQFTVLPVAGQVHGAGHTDTRFPYKADAAIVAMATVRKERPHLPRSCPRRGWCEDGIRPASG